LPTDSTTAASSRAGIKLIAAALLAKRVFSGTEYALISSTMEMKGIYDERISDRPPAHRRVITPAMRRKTLKGVGQGWTYLVGAFETVGTFLGLTMIGSRFMRSLALNSSTLLIELRETEEGLVGEWEGEVLSGSRLKARDVLSYPDLYNLIPNSLLGPLNSPDITPRQMIIPMAEAGRLWDFQRLSWRVMMDITLDPSGLAGGRLLRLPEAGREFKDALSDLGVEVDVGGEEVRAVVSAGRKGRLLDDMVDDEDERREGGDGRVDGDEDGEGHVYVTGDYHPDDAKEEEGGREDDDDDDHVDEEKEAEEEEGEDETDAGGKLTYE